jgi:hypothetical protein
MLFSSLSLRFPLLQFGATLGGAIPHREVPTTAVSVGEWRRRDILVCCRRAARADSAESKAVGSLGWRTS